MVTTANKRFSYSVSISLLFHLLILTLFYFINYEVKIQVDDYIELGFGGSGYFSSSGSIGNEFKDFTEKEELKKESEKFDKADIDLPKAKNKSDESVSIEKNILKNKNSDLQKENKSGGELGALGFDIEWGGTGKRKIYSYILPEYPEGVNKEANIRLRFTILPDGTVGTIFPLIKADTQLENAAINSLRQWKFEPVTGTKKNEQTAVIIFPFRLQ